MKKIFVTQIMIIRMEKALGDRSVENTQMHGENIIQKLLWSPKMHIRYMQKVATGLSKALLICSSLEVGILSSEGYKLQSNLFWEAYRHLHQPAWSVLSHHLFAEDLMHRCHSPGL